jgi:hypothetical protein
MLLPYGVLGVLPTQRPPAEEPLRPSNSSASEDSSSISDRGAAPAATKRQERLPPRSSVAVSAQKAVRQARRSVQELAASRSTVEQRDAPEERHPRVRFTERAYVIEESDDPVNSV